MPGPVEIVLLDQPLHLSAALAHVSVPEAGGIALFVGTTRAERHAVHGMLVRLDYDAYPEMAQRQLGEICAAMRAKWPICRALTTLSAPSKRASMH